MQCKAEIISENSGRRPINRIESSRIKVQIYNLIAVLSAINTGRKISIQEDKILAKKDYSVRKWMVPKKRAESYAKDRKEKVHTYGPKEGQELTDYEAGLRSGYLLCQSDHAGIYKYKKAREEGKSKAEAKRISQKRGK